MLYCRCGQEMTKMSNAEIWNTYVGSCTAQKFIEGYDEPIEAVEEYLTTLSVETPVDLRQALVEYLNINHVITTTR